MYGPLRYFSMEGARDDFCLLIFFLSHNSYIKKKGFPIKSELIKKNILLICRDASQI